MLILLITIFHQRHVCEILRATGSEEVNNCKLRNNENKRNIAMVFYFYQLDSEIGGNGQTELSKHLFPVNL